MFGQNLFFIDPKTLEFLVRKVYAAISYNFNGKIKLRRLQDIQPAFTEIELNEVIHKQNELKLEKIPGSAIESERRGTLPKWDVQLDSQDGNVNLLEEMLSLGAADQLKKA